LRRHLPQVLGKSANGGVLPASAVGLPVHGTNWNQFQVADAANAAVLFDHDIKAPHTSGYGDGCCHRGPRLPAARNRDRRPRDDRSAGTVQMELHGAAGACTGYAHVDGTCARAEIDIAVFGPGAVLREAEIEASIGVSAVFGLEGGD